MHSLVVQYILDIDCALLRRCSGALEKKREILAQDLIRCDDVVRDLLCAFIACVSWKR
jgi:hypothetical protein